MTTATAGNDAVGTMEVCIVEDDAALREEITRVLMAHGFLVRSLSGSWESCLGFLHQGCHMVILDVGLRMEDGFRIAEGLRARSDLGIVMLSERSEPEHHVRSLQGGADVYLVKPVDTRVLVAALHSLARRIRRGEHVSAGRSGDWRLVLDDWCLVTPGGVRVP